MSGPVRLDEVKAEKVDWLWRERIPRAMITVVAGRPDQGKGLFAVHVGSEVTKMQFPDTYATDPETGEILLGEDRQPIVKTWRYGNVLHSAMEDSHGLMTKPRYLAAGARYDGVHLWRFSIPDQLSELERQVIDKKIDLIVMDPFSAHLGRGVSKHSDSIRQVLNPPHGITGVLERTGAALLIVEHVNKRVAKGSHPLSAIGGSGSGLPAAARMGYIFGRDPDEDDARLLCWVKGNIRDKPAEIKFQMDVLEVPLEVDKDGTVLSNTLAPTLVYEDETIFDVMRMLAAKEGESKIGRPADKRAAACEWLTNYLWSEGGPVPSGKVFEDAKYYGMTTKTLRRAAADMEIVKDPPGGGPKCTWSLPDEIIAALTGNDEPAGADSGPEAPTDLSGIDQSILEADSGSGVISDADLLLICPVSDDELE
jgi:hypothetical protein